MPARSDYESFPQAHPLPMPRAALTLVDNSDGAASMLNTCSTAALEELLRLLKRAYWPCAWDTGLDPPYREGVGSQGGFRCAFSPRFPRVCACALTSRGGTVLRHLVQLWRGRTGGRALASTLAGTVQCLRQRTLWACRGAAMDALEGPASVHLQAVARAAEHRLKRGIWTSPGAGDVRRAVAAAERLVLITEFEAAAASASAFVLVVALRTSHVR